MAKKSYYLVLDTETTQPTKDQKSVVYDIGAVVVDRTGKVYNSLSAIVYENFEKDLFYTKDTSKDNHWSYANMKIKTAEYKKMLTDGRATLSSISAINRWLDRVLGAYPDIQLTGYNVAFDLRVCKDTGILLDQFTRRFDLWALAIGNICKSAAYRRFALEYHMFTARTSHGNSSIMTSAECVYRFIINDPKFVEDHTAYSDSVIEKEILSHILMKTSYDKAMQKLTPYVWRDHQLRNFYKVK
jgi:hypothetical protein